MLPELQSRSPQPSSRRAQRQPVRAASSQSLRQPGDAGSALPSHVRTPEGDTLPLFGPDLAADLSRRHGAPIELAHLSRGIFDEASVSLIASATVAAVCQLAAVPIDVRRFRPNILITETPAGAFAEDGWVGGILSFGEADDGAAVFVTNRDERCAMVNYDPDSARPAPELLRAIATQRRNQAGVYATVIRPGRLHIGQPIRFQATGPSRGPARPLQPARRDRADAVMPPATTPHLGLPTKPPTAWPARAPSWVADCADWLPQDGIDPIPDDWYWKRTYGTCLLSFAQGLLIPGLFVQPGSRIESNRWLMGTELLPSTAL